MEEWVEVQKEGLSTLTWWEIMVKPGIRRIAMERSKEINQDKRSQLNLLLLRQTYLVRKVQQSQHQQWGLMLAELTTVQQQIQSWYRKASEKIQHQSRVDEFQIGENTRIYHHEIHKKHLRKSSILKLETDSELLEGHTACAEFLENLVGDLLLVPADLETPGTRHTLS